MPWHLVKGLEQFARILQSCLAALADFQAPCVLLTAGGRVGVTGTQHDHLQTSHPAPWLAGSAALLLQSLSAPGSFINLKKKTKPAQTSLVVREDPVLPLQEARDRSLVREVPHAAQCDQKRIPTYSSQSGCTSVVLLVSSLWLLST